MPARAVDAKELVWLKNDVEERRVPLRAPKSNRGATTPLISAPHFSGLFANVSKLTLNKVSKKEAKQVRGIIPKHERERLLP